MALVHGLLLAAGAGRRMGRPKALVTDPDGTSWLARAVSVLDEGGCAATLVVLGASGEQAELDLPRTSWTHCPDWAKGVGHSLRHGLRVLGEGEADAALVHLVDLPDVTAAVAQRLLGGRWGVAPFGGRSTPGGPVTRCSSAATTGRRSSPSSTATVGPRTTCGGATPRPSSAPTSRPGRTSTGLRRECGGSGRPGPTAVTPRRPSAAR